MRIAAVIVALVVIAVAGVNAIDLYREKELIEAERDELEAKVSELSSQNERLAADADYFSNVHNLGKEIRSLFNYKKPGEALYIIVPPSN